MSPSHTVGETFAGRFKIEEHIGSGAMGTVYRAEHVFLGRQVALKILRSEVSDNPVVRERFLNEPRRAEKTQHPNIIPILDAGEADGQAYIAMTYVEGTDLRERLERDGVLEPGRAIALIAQVASALDAAHARGVVHRDVKPANILVGSDGHVYLSDFGIAKDVALAGGTRKDAFLGTIQYAAPEQIRRQEVDGRADVYALGCVLYHCLAGGPPFDEETEFDLMNAHVSEPPPPLSQSKPGLAPGLDQVLEKALAKKPEDRYQTCSELTAAAQVALLASPAAPAEVPPVIILPPPVDKTLLEELAEAPEEELPSQPEPVEAGGTVIEEEGAPEPVEAGGTVIEEESTPEPVESGGTVLEVPTSKKAEGGPSSWLQKNKKVVAIAAAAALVLVAVIGAVALLAGGSSDGGGGQAANGGGGGGGGEASPAGSEEALLAAVPASFSESCEPVEEESLSTFAAGPDALQPSVATHCESETELPLVLTYLGFEEVIGAQDYYDAALAEETPEGASYGGSEPAGQCDSDVFEGEAPYLIDGIENGRFQCHMPDAGSYRIRWVDPGMNVVGMIGGTLEPSEVDDFVSHFASALGPGGAKALPEFSATPVEDPATTTTEEPTETTESAEPFPTAEETVLLNAVGRRVRRTCEREDAEDFFPRAISGILCTGGGGLIAYDLFRSKGDLRATYNTAFNRLGKPTGLRRNQGNCIDRPVGEASYTYNGKNAGRAFCYRDEDSYTIVWSHEALRILGYLVTTKESRKAQTRLRQFWINRAGPCTKAQHAAGFCG